ncbi:MAG: VanZ family protein [Lachnospiraceae bacterium]|nr:VanZ family protein [Lachnospiraceae bacterium]
MNKLYRILFSLLLITLLVAAIFFFSEQSGSDSHTVSTHVCEKIADAWADTFWTDSNFYSKDILASMLDAPIRKLAHLFIYTALGCGTCIIANILSGRKVRFYHVLLCILTVMLVASFDEYNQYYSGGRGASLNDVWLDTVGGCFGIYLVFMAKDFVRHIINGIKREKEIRSSKK